MQNFLKKIQKDKDKIVVIVAGKRVGMSVTSEYINDYLTE